MDSSEVEFLAEKELITVLPNFKQDKLYLLSVSITYCIAKFSFFTIQSELTNGCGTPQNMV